ncbi:Pejvakin [Chelonia mydas]|uniref:Pejvakin n=1 Tax=Chelonia mydas TaxID=8469 RepID=M7B7D4_CHEMY|nr:Pejvakin [Chelonia mydas]
MFARAAKQLTKELDSDGRLIPISSLASADSYRPFCLVRKKQPWLPLQPPKYLITPYKLTDIFKEGTTMDAEVKYVDLLRYSETTDQKAGGKLSLKLQPTEVDFACSGKSLFSVSPISVRKAYVSKKGQWKIDTSHKFIKEFSGSPGTQLYVVTEAFELKEPLHIQKMSQGGGKVVITAGEIGEIQHYGVQRHKDIKMYKDYTYAEGLIRKCSLAQNRKFLFVSDDLDFRVLTLLVTCLEKNMVAKQLALVYTLT